MCVTWTPIPVALDDTVDVSLECYAIEYHRLIVVRATSVGIDRGNPVAIPWVSMTG